MSPCACPCPRSCHPKAARCGPERYGATQDLARGFHEPGDKPRRFYGAVSVAPMNGGFTVMLDGRTLRGPKGTPTVLPTQALADEIAGEWAGQGEHLHLAAMHATRLAN